METAAFELEIESIKRSNGKSAAPTLDDDEDIADAFAGPHDTFQYLQRYQSAVERSYFRSVETLRKAQNDRRREERRNAPPQRIGYVSKGKAAAAASAASAATPARKSCGPKHNLSPLHPRKIS